VSRVLEGEGVFLRNFILSIVSDLSSSSLVRYPAGPTVDGVGGSVLNGIGRGHLEPHALSPLCCDRFHVSGMLNLSHQGRAESKSVWCTFVFARDWLSSLPDVYVSRLALWKVSAEWHCFGGNRICYAHQLDWESEVAPYVRLEGGAGAVRAARYMMDLVRSLLCRHLEARRSNMPQWPAQWQYRSHASLFAPSVDFYREHPSYERLTVGGGRHLLGEL
jgi:hypothetical protein